MTGNEGPAPEPHIELTPSPEAISPDEIQIFDVLHIPDIDENYVLVTETVHAVGGQWAKLALTGHRRGEVVEHVILWSETVVRVGTAS